MTSLWRQRWYLSCDLDENCVLVVIYQRDNITYVAMTWAVTFDVNKVSDVFGVTLTPAEIFVDNLDENVFIWCLFPREWYDICRDGTFRRMLLLTCHWRRWRQFDVNYDVCSTTWMKFSSKLLVVVESSHRYPPKDYMSFFISIG